MDESSSIVQPWPKRFGADSEQGKHRFNIDVRFDLFECSRSVDQGVEMMEVVR